MENNFKDIVVNFDAEAFEAIEDIVTASDWGSFVCCIG